jgi:2-methylcitrate dehydratase
VFEGKEGVFEVLNTVTWDANQLLDGLGKTFLITECGYKAFPTEALTHQPITAVLELRKEHRIDPHAVTEILVKTTTRGADILSDPSKYRPTTKETADHSLPYCVAVATAKGNVLPSDFRGKALKDPLVWELLPKIKVVADPEIDALFPKVKRAIVTITTEDGKRYTKQEDFAKGQAERPLTDEELTSKFRSNAALALSGKRLDEIVHATFDLEKLPDVGTYMKLLVRDR